MSGPHEYSMCGVKVKFPAKAYPSQVAMMSKIVTSIQRSQNSLLESPTGSGKSLALLCAALAWQEVEQNKCNEFNTILEQATINQDPAMRDMLVNMAGSEGVEWEEEIVSTDEAAAFAFGNVSADEAAAVALGKSESMGGVGGGGFIPADPDDADFYDPREAAKPVRPEVYAGYHLPDGDVKKVGSGAGYLRMPKRKKCPRIYFGTRTHKQIAQIVRELKKTAYSGVRMTILASREHTCIHPTISKSFNKTQDCVDLMDKRKGGGCRFQANVKQKMSSHHSVRSYMGSDKAWDLEELVKAGKKVKCCPYYGVRELKNSAQIIFCPYNYLVDPGIRSSMEIFLNNQIVILDEAHNIEDSARDAASANFKLDDVTTALQDCERMVEHDILPDVHSGLAAFLSRLGTWIQKAADDANDYSDFNSSTKVWSGTAGLAEWNEIVFYPENYEAIKMKLQEALKEQKTALEQNDDDNPGLTKVLSKKSSDLIGGIFSVLDFMHRKDSVYRDDYKMSVVRAQERKKGGKAKGWTGKGDTPALVTTISLNFWCLNPGVCFDEMLDCRSIVLTSGTLSPMVTFASELAVKFPITLEANHVIDKSQVWVGTLGIGPTGNSLNAAYQNANTYGFQDEVGRLVLEICRTIPHGVLVFFPSYKMMNDLSERWKSNGTWQQLFERKAIVTEPRFGDQLDVAMKEFYSVIEASNNQPNEYGQDGALFMAVCRGKVSEGLDFADNNARAVVCVGIPFPAFKDTLVDLKKKYNDGRRSVNPNILPGREWYEIQAFRALNQALGRCIRHKKDWGAILMVDDRYGRNPRYVNNLSKWVRGKVVHYNNCNMMTNSLKTFSTDMKHFEAENETVADAFTAPPKSDSSTPPTDTYFNPTPDQTSTAWSPNPGASLSLASKVSSLVSLRKSSPELPKDNKTSGFKRSSQFNRKKAENADAQVEPNHSRIDSKTSLSSVLEASRKQAQLASQKSYSLDCSLRSGNHPDLGPQNDLSSVIELARKQAESACASNGPNLDIKTHLTSVLDSRTHLSGLDNPCISAGDPDAIPLEGEKVRLGPPKSRTRQKKLKEQEKFAESKIDWNNPEEGCFQANMNFNGPAESPGVEESFETLYNDSTSNLSTTSNRSSNLGLIINTNKNLNIIPSQSKKSRMRFVSTSSEDNSPTKSLIHPNVSIDTSNHSSIPAPVPPYTSSRISMVNPATSSPNIRSDSCKRKKGTISSPECNFDLSEEFDLPDNAAEKEKKWTKSGKSIHFKQKLQKFKYDPSIESGSNESLGYEDPTNKLKANNLTDNLPDLMSETQVSPQSEFVSGASIFGAASKKSRFSTCTESSDPSNASILRYSSVSKLEKENSQEKELQIMLKKRRESGKSQFNYDPSSIVLETPESSTIVLETPDDMDNYELGSDFEEEYEPSKPGVLADLSNQPVSTRKPLFNQNPSKPTTVLPKSTSKHSVENTVIYSSDDDVWPEEKKKVQISLSSADEIEEPEQEILRKVKLPVSKTIPRKKKNRGVNSSLVEGGKKGRLSLALGSSIISGNNSDDDFM